jgi:hypothetical protein
VKKSALENAVLDTGYNAVHIGENRVKVVLPPHLPGKRSWQMTDDEIDAYYETAPALFTGSPRSATRWVRANPRPGSPVLNVRTPALAAVA